MDRSWQAQARSLTPDLGAVAPPKHSLGIFQIQKVILLEAGHFALESQGPEIAAMIRGFLVPKLTQKSRAAQGVPPMTMNDSLVASVFDRRNLIKSAGFATRPSELQGPPSGQQTHKASPTKTSSTSHSIWNIWKVNTICAPQPGRD
jgi:hypothetical protein